MDLFGFLVNVFFKLMNILLVVKIIFVILFVWYDFVKIGLNLLEVNLLIGLVIVLFFNKFFGDIIINGCICLEFKLVVCVCNKWK